MGEPVPEAPWHSRVDAVLWVGGATAAMRAGLEPALGARAVVPAVLGGLVAYRAGPVGAYGELFAAPLLVRRGVPVGHVAFMAVDSAPSRAGGRANWALPKVMAAFASDAAGGRVAVTGDGWAVTVTPRLRPHALAIRAAFPCAQVWPDGVVRRFVVGLRGHARLGTVAVELRSDGEGRGDPAPWLRPGRHPALAVAGAQVVGAARAGR